MAALAQEAPQGGQHVGVSALEFISSVAWPVTILVIALMFRKSITEMLSGPLSRMKAGPFEWEWRRTFVEVEAEIDSAVPAAADDRSEGGLVEELASLAQRSPSTAVLEAYARVEQELRRVAGEPPVDPHRDLNRVGARTLAQTAFRGGRLSAQTVQAVEGISVLRNLAAHGRAGDVTPERALDYLSLVDGVLFAIRREQQPSEG
jgi:hypothetical protein